MCTRPFGPIADQKLIKYNSTVLCNHEELALVRMIAHMSSMVVTIKKNALNGDKGGMEKYEDGNEFDNGEQSGTTISANKWWH